MPDDPLPAHEQDDVERPVARRRRWPMAVACIFIAVVVGLGAWQIVQLRHDVTALQSQNRSQHARLESQQTQLNDLNSALSTTASGTSLGQLNNQISTLKNQISTIEGFTTNLNVRIGCVFQALNSATANPDGSLSVADR